MYWEACHYRFGLANVTEDDERSKILFFKAAELGHRHAMVSYGLFFPRMSLDRWIWLGKAAREGKAEKMIWFFLYFSKRSDEPIFERLEG